MFPSQSALNSSFRLPFARTTAVKSVPMAAAAAEGALVPPGSPKFFGLCSIGGILSCGLTHWAVTPIDLVKCRMQTNPEQYKSLFGGLRTLVKSGDSLLTGHVPTFIGYSIQGFFKFGLYEVGKWYYSGLFSEETAHKYRSLIYVAASASAEFVADIGLCPFEAVKVRVQTSPGFAKGLADGMPKIYNAEGISGLFKGVVPLWSRQIPYTIMKFVSFEGFVELFYKLMGNKPRSSYSSAEQLGVTFASGYAAGVFCAVISHPADVMVSLLNKSSGTATVGSIYKEIGFAGLWKGLPVRILMVGTLTCLQWVIYDSFKIATGLVPAKK